MRRRRNLACAPASPSPILRSAASAARLEGSRRPSSTLLERIPADCYFRLMTQDQVKKLLDRVAAWPPERQADLAHIVDLMEEQDSSPLRLTEEQAAEVRRRLAEPNPQTLTLAEFNERLRQRYGV